MPIDMSFYNHKRKKIEIPENPAKFVWNLLQTPTVNRSTPTPNLPENKIKTKIIMTTSSTNATPKWQSSTKKILRTSKQRHGRAPPLSKPPQTLEQPTFHLSLSILHQNMSNFLFSMYLRRGNQRRRSGGASGDAHAWVGESVGLHSWGSERWKECEGLVRARWRVLWCAGSRNSYTRSAGGRVLEGRMLY